MTRIEQRYDTAARWTSQNPRLLKGEVGWESDTRKAKVGDGVNRWNTLAYAVGSIPTKASLGLGNVDNTSDMDKPISAATQAEFDDMVDAFDQALGTKADGQATQAQFIDLTGQIQSVGSQVGSKAPIADPTFTGNPKAPTPATADNDTSLATTAFVKNQSYATKTELAAERSRVYTGAASANPPASASTSTWFAVTATQAGWTAFVAPPSGVIEIIVGGYLRSATSGQLCLLDFEIREGDVYGAGTLIRSGQIPSSTGTADNVLQRPKANSYFEGLTPGSTYHARTMLWQGAANGSFSNLSLQVITH